MEYVLQKIGTHNKNESTTKLLALYWELMEIHNIRDHSFYDGRISTFEQFAGFVFNGMADFFLIFEVDVSNVTHPAAPTAKKPELVKPVGHVHLTNFQGYVAQVHFGFLPVIHKIGIEVAEKVIQGIFNIARVDGSPYVEEMFGITPMVNRGTRKLLESVGFEILTTLKKACYINKTGKYYDGVLSKITRESVQE